MLYIVDKAVINEVHVMFNSSMLNMLYEVFPKGKLLFMADAQHIKYVKENLDFDSEQIQFQSIKIQLSFSSGLKKIPEWIVKVGSDIIFFINLLRKIRRSEDILFLLNAPPMSLLFFKFIKCFFPNKKVVHVLHGELEHVYYANDRREKGIGSFYKLMFKLPSKNLRYVLLNKLAKKRLVDDGFIVSKHTIEINHPYSFKEVRTKSYNKDKILTFANIGSLMKRKNGQLIFNLAHLLSKEIADNLLILKTIGAVENDMHDFDNGLILGVEKGKDILHHLDRNEFENQVSEVDYALFFITHEQFVFRASGAILDVINHGIPIIALKHPLFESLFESVGSFGYLCESITDMNSLIRTISTDREKYQSDYHIFGQNIKKLKDEYSTTEIAADFKTQYYNV